MSQCIQSQVFQTKIKGGNVTYTTYSACRKQRGIIDKYTYTSNICIKLQSKFSCLLRANLSTLASFLFMLLHTSTVFCKRKTFELCPLPFNCSMQLWELLPPSAASSDLSAHHPPVGAACSSDLSLELTCSFVYYKNYYKWQNRNTYP